MKWRRCNAKAQSSHDCNQSNLRDPRHVAWAMSIERVQNCRDICCARQTVQVAEAKEQNCRRENAQQEVFQGGFLRLIVMAGQIQENISWDTDQFQRQEKTHEIVG